MYLPSITLLSALATVLVSSDIVTAGSLRSRDISRSHKAIAERNAYHPFHSPEWQQIVDGVPAEKKRKVHGKQKRKVKRAKTCIPKSSTALGSSAAASTVASSRAAPSSSASSTLIVGNYPATSGFVSTVATASESSSTPASSFYSASAPASSFYSASSSTQTATPVPSASATSTAIVSSSSAVSNAPITVDPEGNGPFNGETTYYVLGNSGTAIGACGNYLVDSDKIAAASEYLFDYWPGATANPNNNPICGLYAKVHYQGKSVVVRIEDRCPGCDKRHLDLSPSAFLELAPLSVGLMDVTWEWVSGPNA